MAFAMRNVVNHVPVPLCGKFQIKRDKTLWGFVPFSITFPQEIYHLRSKYHPPKVDITGGGATDIAALFVPKTNALRTAFFCIKSICQDQEPVVK